MKKHYTIFISSNDKKDSVKQWCVSAVHIRMLLIGLVGFAILLIGFAVDYAFVFSSRRSAKKHLAKNQMLQSQITYIQGKMERLYSRLNQIEDFAVQLKFLAGLEDKAKGSFSAMAMGPLPGSLHSSSGEAVDDRAVKTSPPAPLFSPGQKSHIDSLIVYIDKLDEKSRLIQQNEYTLLKQLYERQDIISSTPSIIPVRGWISSYFGYRQYPLLAEKVSLHEGIDIAALPKTPVYAPADGEIIFAGYRMGYGNTIIIDHGYQLSTLYGHLSDIWVSAHQKVKRREVIGVTGNTGHSSGPHLHYEVRIAGVPVDPINYIVDEI